MLPGMKRSYVHQMQLLQQTGHWPQHWVLTDRSRCLMGVAYAREKPLPSTCLSCVLSGILIFTPEKLALSKVTFFSFTFSVTLRFSCAKLLRKVKSYWETWIKKLRNRSFQTLCQGARVMTAEEQLDHQIALAWLQPRHSCFRWTHEDSSCSIRLVFPFPLQWMLSLKIWRHPRRPQEAFRSMTYQMSSTSKE